MEMEHLIKLIETVSRSGLSQFEYEDGGLKIRMEKSNAPQTNAHAFAALPIGEEAVESVTEDHVVTCPLVGIFYVAPEENAEPFVKVGERVKKGQTLAIVEAMKLMNEIESEYDGVVAEILAQNGKAVEFGQPLFRIR